MKLNNSSNTKEDFWTDYRIQSRQTQLREILLYADSRVSPPSRRLNMDKLAASRSPMAAMLSMILTHQDGEYVLNQDLYDQIESDEIELNYVLRLHAASDIAWIQFMDRLENAKSNGQTDRLVELYHTMEVYTMPDELRGQINQRCFGRRSITVDEVESMRSSLNYEKEGKKEED